MNIAHLSIEGLKGPARAFGLSPLTLVTGPNGQGKSAILDAVRFVLGAGEVAGVADGGPLLAAAVVEDAPLRVSATLDNGTKIERERGRAAGGGLAKPRFLGTPDVSWPKVLPPVSWLSLSSDALQAELATIGAATRGLDPEEVSSRRDEAKQRLNAAVAAKRRLEASADVSRERAQGEETCTPEHLVAAQQRRAEAQKRLQDARDALGIIERGHQDHAVWRQRQRAWADAQVAVARIAPTSDAADAAFVEQNLAAVEADLRALREELSLARERLAHARGDADRAERRAKDLAAGACPTCAQPIPADLAASLGSSQAFSASVVKVRQRAVDEAQAACTQSEEDVTYWRGEREKALAARDLLRQRDALLLVPEPGPEPERIDRGLASAQVANAEAALQAAQAEVDRVARAVERRRRWQEDLAARTRAEAEVERAQSDLSAVLALEVELLDEAALVLDRSIALPKGWRVKVLRDPLRLALDVGGGYVTGAGLSGAQRAALAVACEAARALALGGTFALHLIEADAFDGEALVDLLEALAKARRDSVIDQAIVATCHDLPLPDGWTRIDLAPLRPYKPGLTVETVRPPEPPRAEGDFRDDWDGGYAPAEENLDLFDAPAATPAPEEPEASAADSLEEVWPSPPASLAASAPERVLFEGAAVYEPPPPPPATEPCPSPGIGADTAHALLAGTSADAVRLLWSQHGGHPQHKMTLSVSRWELAKRIAGTWAHPDEVRAKVEAAKALHPKRKAPAGAPGEGET